MVFPIVETTKPAAKTTVLARVAAPSAGVPFRIRTVVAVAGVAAEDGDALGAATGCTAATGGAAVTVGTGAGVAVKVIA